MKPLLFASCLAIFSLFAKPAIAIEGEHQLYADLLTRGNSTYFKVAAQSIYNKQIQDIELIDMLAEVFAKRIHGEIYFDPDTTAWLAKAIGTSGSKRYTSLLNIAKNSDISRKARKHVKTSLGKLTKASDSQFVKGSIDLAQKAQEISQQRKALDAKITPEAFAKVATGDTIEQVLSKLGMPNSVEVAFATQRRPWVGVVSYSMLQLIYTQQGSFNFNYVGKLKNWTVKIINPKIDIGEGLANHPMMAKSASSMRSHIKRLVKSASATQLDRDIAAERLYTDIDKEEFVDTLSWACRLLGLSGTTRYRDTLRYVSKNAPARKLRKYAEKYLAKLPTGSEEQYKQGDVLKQGD